MKEEVLNNFDHVTNELLTLLSSLTEEELNKIPFENSWTAGQLGDHLFKSYAVVEILNGQVESTSRHPNEKLQDIKKLFFNFEIKMDSPKEILPTDEFIKKEVLLYGLKKRIKEQRNVILNKDLTKICTDFSIPEYGDFTRMEWIGFNTIHTQRHVQQLKNIISHLKTNNT